MYVIHQNGKVYNRGRNCKAAYMTEKDARIALTSIISHGGYSAEEFEIVEYVPKR